VTPSLFHPETICHDAQGRSAGWAWAIAVAFGVVAILSFMIDQALIDLSGGGALAGLFETMFD